VRPYLRNELYIINTVFREVIHHGLSECDYELLWKMVGYTMGPVALRHILLPLLSLRVVAEDQLKPTVEAQIDAQIARKMLVAARTLPVASNPHFIRGGSA
jgi:hypothetical protein